MVKSFKTTQWILAKVYSRKLKLVEKIKNEKGQ